jgi:hypothetical protein
MNKIIFQIGMLAFCVSTVLFSSQGSDLMETVARSFVVFVVTVCALAVVLFAVASIPARPAIRPNMPAGGSNPSAQSMGDNAPHAAA